jgi:hypothetical protein
MRVPMVPLAGTVRLREQTDDSMLRTAQAEERGQRELPRSHHHQT